MKTIDFEYDGILLSDKGFILCMFDNNGIQTVSNGSQITFNTVSTLNGGKYELSSSNYDNCLTTTFQICKTPCNTEDIEISVSEFRELMSWLNRKEFHKFKLLDDKYSNLYFEASFNINRIEVNRKFIGLELEMITNRPFALLEPVTITLENMEQNGEQVVSDASDEEAFIYPETEITIQEDGDLSISDSLENRTMYIKNCKVGEVIKLSYPIIESSLSSHKIQNDFNWNFLRIANKYKSKENTYTISIPCTINLTYSPIVKMGI